MAYLQQLFNEVYFLTPTQGVLFAGVLACLLLFVSGFTSGSEIAFFSLSPTDLNKLEESNEKCDKQILELRNDSERTLATILITNNLVNVTIIMLCNYFIAHVIYFGNVVWLQFLTITVLLTFLLLLQEQLVLEFRLFIRSLLMKHTDAIAECQHHHEEHHHRSDDDDEEYACVHL